VEYPLLLLPLLLPQGSDRSFFLPGRWLRGCLQIWQSILHSQHTRQATCSTPQRMHADSE
jgi:hypothetical protein